MPGLQQNDNRKPNISFAGTEAIRKLMLSKNLPNPTTSPYFDKRNTGPDEFSKNSYRIHSMRDMAVPDQLTVDEQAEFYLDKSYLANAYGPPGGFGDWIQIYDTSQKIAKVNEGFYPNFSPPETGTGLFGENPFRQVAQYYSPMDILLGVTAQGLLSTTLLEDSELQQQGAIQLHKEFQERIAQELYQETIGRLNFMDALKDPFRALDIVTGRDSIIERDNNITVPKSLVGKGVDFISRLTGVYVPRSYIPGDYFELEPPRGLGTAGKIVSDITGIMGSLIGIPRRRQSPSQRFLEYTGGGSKSQLFKHIRYNVYGPQYGEGAQAQTAIGAGIGEAIDFVKGGILGAGNFPPNPPQYIGGPRNRVADMTSPPDSTYAGKNYIPQFGPDAVAKEFDENDYNFGLKGLAYINQGTVPAGFTWYTDKTPGSGFLNSVASLFQKKEKRVGPQVPGTSQGVEGSTDDTTKYEIPNGYDASKSTNYQFREDSLMDVTQQIVDSVPKGGAGLKSVSHSINQVSKVFNDGYKELTKGSRVKRFINTDPTDGNGVEQEREYCRIWTKDIPYYTYGNLVKSQMNHRKETYSVLDSPYNLNIAPWRTDETGKGSTNIKNGKVKKYMFSIENLAWRTSSEKGFTYDDLPTCEKGPNGGRIMWFPPYDLQVDESSNANWTENNFVGRPEPVYTYNHTNRTGTLRFKIVVDHPSVLNLIVRKELQNLGPKETDAIVDSFFAGCKNYDIYDLARKWKQFSVNELAEAKLVLNDPNVNKDSKAEVATGTATDVADVAEATTQIPTFDASEYPAFYFENDYPDPNTKEPESTVPFNALATGGASKNGESYLSNDKVTENRYLGQAEASQQVPLQEWFTKARVQYDTKWKNLAEKLHKALEDGYEIKLSMVGSASSLASTGYNKTLSERRLDSIKQMFQNYTLGGKNVFKLPMENSKLIFPTPEALGESKCTGVPDSGVAAIFSEPAAECRKVYIDDIKVKEKVPEPPTPDPIIRKERPTTKKQKIDKLRDKNTRREIANKVLMKMVTECDYFDLISEENEFIYDALKEKFKFFQPAFHAITPEGLNSRLTFLNQCVRPGATIPTKQENGGLSTGVDAKNTAFGAPPICILRVGDFYHTKIAIDSIAFTYEDNLLDLNPEGIGVQPMIASVSVIFKYLGGQGLKEPVSRLQNALSFNYYANTEMYDDRSVLTVTDEEPDEAAWIAQNQDLIKTTQATGGPNPEEDAAATEQENTAPNDGIMIGNREDQKLTTTGESGTVTYQSNFNDISERAYDYLKNVNEELFNIITEHNYGLIELLYAEKEWDKGDYYRAGGTPTKINGELVGIPLDYQKRFNNLIAAYKTKIENETTYIQQECIAKANPTNAQKRKLKDFLEEQTEDAESEINYILEQANLNIRSAHIEYLRHVTPLNVINQSGDGYIEEGKTTVFALSGGTPVDATSINPTPSDTLVELGNDYFYLTNVLSCYSKLMNGTTSIPLSNGSGVSNEKLTGPGKFTLTNSEADIENKADTQLNKLITEYLLFSREMVDKNSVDTLIPLNQDVPYFKEYSATYKNTGSVFFDELKEIFGLNPQGIDPAWIGKIRTDITKGTAKNDNYYLEQFVTVKEEFIEKVISETPTYLTQGFSSDISVTLDQKLTDQKTRKLKYTKTTNPTTVENLADYNSKTNSQQGEHPQNFNLKFN